MSKQSKYKKIIKEWNEATPYEVWEGVRDNFIFGFLGAILVVFISQREDIAVIIGIYQIPKCSLLMADEILLSGSDSDSIAAALGRILIAKEQTAIFTAAIKTNRVESLWVDLLARDTMDSIRLKIAASPCLVKIKNDFNHLFNDDYRKKVALPLSLMVTHLLICEEKPNPTELFEVCYGGIPWCIGTVLAGKIDEVIDACSNLNSQINI